MEILKYVIEFFGFFFIFLGTSKLSKLFSKRDEEKIKKLDRLDYLKVCLLSLCFVISEYAFSSIVSIVISMAICSFAIEILFFFIRDKKAEEA